MSVNPHYLTDGFRSLYCNALKEMVYRAHTFGPYLFLFVFFFSASSDSGRL